MYQREIKGLNNGQYIGYVKIGTMNIFAYMDFDYHKVNQQINLKYELLQRT